MNKNDFDAIAFVNWFESIIDFIAQIFASISNKFSPSTTATEVVETTTESPVV